MPHLYLIFVSLWDRFRRGEGALLAINAAIIWFERPGLYIGGVELVLSFVVLAVLYGFNDLHDAESDRNNPKKNQQLVSAFIRQGSTFYLWIGATKLGLLVLAYVLLDVRAAVAVFSIFAVNMLYSLWLKGVPVADILLVAAWGAAYSAIATPPWSVFLLVGIMTSVSHIFQILSDREADATNQVRTTAVFSGRATTGMLAAASIALFFALARELGPVWSLTAFVPLALHMGVTNVGTAWWLSRIYFGVTLMVVLGGFRGHP